MYGYSVHFLAKSSTLSLIDEFIIKIESPVIGHRLIVGDFFNGLDRDISNM